jgi:hypothetical protein
MQVIFSSKLKMEKVISIFEIFVHRFEIEDKINAELVQTEYNNNIQSNLYFDIVIKRYCDKKSF